MKVRGKGINAGFGADRTIISAATLKVILPVWPYNTHMSSQDLPIVRLKIERKSTHPWIFQKMVEKPETKPRPGSIVDIVDATNHWVARGFYISDCMEYRP